MSPNAIVTPEDVANPKPFPDIYLKATQLLKHLPINNLAIEDSAIGLQSAIAAKLQTLWFRSSNQELATKMKDKINFTAESFLQIKNFILRLVKH